METSNISRTSIVISSPLGTMGSKASSEKKEPETEKKEPETEKKESETETLGEDAEKRDRETANASKAETAKPTPSKAAKEIMEQSTSKELTILRVMMMYHMRGTTAVTFDRIRKDMGYQPKNKLLDEAWKNVRNEAFVEDVTSSGAKKLFQLTEKGIDRAAPEEYKFDLANPPKNTEELHARIKQRAMNDKGVKIFDLLLDKGPLTGKELADTLDTKEGSHAFFYAFKELKDKGLAEVDVEATKNSGKRKQKYRLSAKAFIDSESVEPASKKQCSE